MWARERLRATSKQGLEQCAAKCVLPAPTSPSNKTPSPAVSTRPSVTASGAVWSASCSVRSSACECHAPRLLGWGVPSARRKRGFRRLWRLHASEFRSLPDVFSAGETGSAWPRQGSVEIRQVSSVPSTRYSGMLHSGDPPSLFSTKPCICSERPDWAPPPFPDLNSIMDGDCRQRQRRFDLPELLVALFEKPSKPPRMSTAFRWRSSKVV